MKMAKVMGAAALTALMSLGGCASIVSDSKPKVGVFASPRVTTFTITDSTGRVVRKGTTPAQVILETSRGYFKRESYTITFHREGYTDDVQKLRPTVSGWYWWNILLGGAIGMLIVDPLTGAMYTLPDDVTGRPSPLAPVQAAEK
ncbi:hypothetical protein [Pseudomonas chlororaphis]|uniref:hypothetical protein n=1 Tax=Pseudomonas chlororaphis TaxID=587753 RepID=UPI0023653448|nr:hypothetical protein [Pseudomonas chlororaphis]WDH25009.1 hypothetical protein PUP50_12275 [Pseudomonas chlororaphis]